MKSIAAALKFLTIWNRFMHSRADPVLVGKAAPYFPLIGLLLGLMLALLNRALDNYVDSELLSVVLITILIIVTGGNHLQGLQRTFDAMSVVESPAPATFTNGAVGTIAIVLVLFFKIKSIDILEDKLTFGLLLTPAFARWALVVFIYGSYRHCEGETSLIAQNVRFWHLLVTSFAILALATYLLGRIGLWIGLCLSAFALICRTFWQKRTGVLTCDHFGAVIELSEALSLALLASF